ncbi:MAG: primosomal protein N' [Bacteroidota bacterium]
MSLFSTTTGVTTYVDVILPLAIPKLYTYTVPDEFKVKAQRGVRVEVQFGRNKIYSALIYKTHEDQPAYSSKPIISILDSQPIVNDFQLKLWDWMSSYYCCTKGEVMHAAFPAGLKLASETRILLSPDFNDDFTGLSDKEYLVTEALTLQNELSIDDIQKILNQKTVYPIINSLLVKEVILVKEELKTKFRPRTVSCVRLAEPYRSDPETLKSAFEAIGTRAIKQVSTLMAFIQLSRIKERITKKDLTETVDTNQNIIKNLQKKGIFEIYDVEVSRIGKYEDEIIGKFELSAQQAKALIETKANLEERNVCLIHGVTGSGKTELYIELIQEVINSGKQVLYLLPEIALTAQIINRLQKVFGDDIAVYHSKLNNNERVEIWHLTHAGKPIILGARSALFLPFKDIGLIVIDEEHDPSYKQQDPAPRYNGRDCAIFLAHLHGAKVVLGTATPSVETYSNAKNGKYGLVEMTSRFGGIQMPEIEIINTAEEVRKKKMKSHFTSRLLEELEAALERGEQAILFQNRRGYAPTMRCETCGWNAMCINCDVSLTYHKYTSNLRCHYCGYQTKQPTTCAACGSHELKIQGFGTEKIEDELKIFLPDAKVGRMDWDTVRGKHGHQKIIHNFEEKRIDILVGTQMVTKGLDFDNVGIVGVLSADHLLHFPDFRASERAFQLLTQVSGRAGRKHKRGKVLIQAYNPGHHVLADVLNNDFANFFEKENQERQSFLYPPYMRLIKITLKHKKKQIVDEGVRHFARDLKEKLGNRVLGPAEPGVSRVRSYYLMDILLKLERKKELLAYAKKVIKDAEINLYGRKGMSSIKINVDVDPY